MYGTTYSGGSSNLGTVFAFTLPPVPSLAIIQTENQASIFWPAWATNYVLQTSTNLFPGSWSSITDGIGSVGINNVFTNTMTNRTTFYRLQSQ